MQYSNISSRIRAYMEERGIDQAELARLASVSQPTISRLLKGREPRRLGIATGRVFSYMQQNTSDQLPDAVSRAVVRIWNRTPAHAEALAKIIEATEGLEPVDTSERR